MGKIRNIEAYTILVIKSEGKTSPMPRRSSCRCDSHVKVFLKEIRREDIMLTQLAQGECPAVTSSEYGSEPLTSIQEGGCFTE
jgi:hypothetical protein